MNIDVIQWCDSVEQVFELLIKPVVTIKELWDIGCHWTPSHMPIKAKIIEVVSEIHSNEIVFNLVKFKSEVIGSEIGYTLIPVIYN